MDSIQGFKRSHGSFRYFLHHYTSLNSDDSRLMFLSNFLKLKEMRGFFIISSYRKLLKLLKLINRNGKIEYNYLIIWQSCHMTHAAICELKWQRQRRHIRYTIHTIQNEKRFHEPIIHRRYGAHADFAP